jgi:hypothetical protein
MSKFSNILGSVTDLLGLGTPKAPAIPAPQVPAPPAPVLRTDTGAIIQVGNPTANSKKSSSGGSSIAGNVLGGLGGGSGLNI